MGRIILFNMVTLDGFFAGPDGEIDWHNVAEKMNMVPKIVFSRTLGKAEWNNTRLVKENVAEEIVQLKQQPGKDLFIFGSADLASTISKLGLIDEYRLMVNPVVLGVGKPLFIGRKERLNLRLLQARAFRNGNVLLYYQPI